ncbi:MAG: hypothetical protein CMM60_03835 [Rhodospirillaceae bacterium]|nr:hypothetical protein [Rhodospirillaceae bacterium]
MISACLLANLFVLLFTGYFPSILRSISYRWGATIEDRLVQPYTFIDEIYKVGGTRTADNSFI